MRRAGPCPPWRCAAPRARARSRRGGAVGARETADGGTFGANGAQHSSAEHRPVCQAGYLHGYCGRSPWRWNGARSPAYHAEPGVGQRCSRVDGRTQKSPRSALVAFLPPGQPPTNRIRADQERQRRGCQSPSVTNLAASGQPLMTAACPCPGCYCEYLTAAGRIAGSSSRYARSATSPGRPHKPGMMRACRWIGHLPVTWIWMAAQGATRLGWDSYRAATVEHILTLEFPGRVLRVTVRAGKPEWPPPRQPR